MFENLSERLVRIFASLTSKGRLSEADVDGALREIRLALLEADVHYTVVKEFVSKLRERAVGTEVLSSLTPGQQVVKIVLEELTALLGGTAARLVLSGRTPNVVMLVGLQGSGKTTAAAKLARVFAAQGRRPLLVACDTYRPAAIEQLETLGSEIGVPVFRGDGADPVSIASDGVRAAREGMRDLVIIDTAGRLHVDEAMMAEAERIKSAVRPDQVLLVLDAMTGQDAVNVATSFSERLGFDGIILTKLDGDARGGAALSLRYVSGRPILFVSEGERTDSLSVFHPDRMAKRILGMGDVISLIERAQEAAAEAGAAPERLASGELTLDDFLGQLRQVRRLGGIGALLSALPGAAALKDMPDVDDRSLDRIEAIILSMTPRERQDPRIVNGSRRLRIARGAGVDVSDVNRLLKQYAEARKLMKRLGGGPQRGRGKKVRPPGGPWPTGLGF